MDPSFQCYFEGEFLAIQELEKRLKFRFLTQISFETDVEEQEIREKGLRQLMGGAVSHEALQLGVKFFPQIQSGFIAKVSIRWISDQVEHGLFVEEEMDAGAYVGEYVGIVRRNDLRRYFAPLNNYCYTYPVEDEIGKSLVIDATGGNLTRFINHSYGPNLKPHYAFHDGFYHLIFLTMRRIEKGEQLFYDYGQNYWNIRSGPISF